MSIIRYNSHFIARLNDSFDIALRNLVPESCLSSYSNLTEIINTHCTFYPHLLNPNNNYSLELSGF